MPPRKKSNPRAKVGIPSRLQENKSKVCAVEDCARPRFTFSKYCNRHTLRRRKFGSPEATTLPREHYKRELSEVGKFLRRFEYQHHPAIQAGVDFFARWMKLAMEGKDVPGKRSLVNLARHQTSPRRILHEVLAAWLYTTRRNTPATRAPFLLGNAMLRCSPNEKSNDYYRSDGSRVKSYRSPGYHERADITRTIRKELALLMAGMLEYLKENEKVRNESIKKMSTKFSAKPRNSSNEPAYKKPWRERQKPPNWIDGRTKAGRAAKARRLAGTFGFDGAGI